MDSTPCQQFAPTLELTLANLPRLQVIKAACKESLSQSHHCIIEAYCTNFATTPEQFQGQPATLSLKTTEQINQFSGYIFNTKTLQTTAHSIRYQLELEPK
ncbi:type VI secretion system tip protein VgrG, partial [Piscirickettsiaceae bacterium NZ-RLO2]